MELGFAIEALLIILVTVVLTRKRDTGLSAIINSKASVNIVGIIEFGILLLSMLTVFAMFTCIPGVIEAQVLDTVMELGNVMYFANRMALLVVTIASVGEILLNILGGISPIHGELIGKVGRSVSTGKEVTVRKVMMSKSVNIGVMILLVVSSRLVLAVIDYAKLS